MNDCFEMQYKNIVENDHDQTACNLLKHYDLQADYPDGTPKGADRCKSLSWYANKYGYNVNQLKEHWRCIDK